MRRRPWVLPALAAAAFLLLQVPLRHYIVDDAYIHLTFARNLARGYGFAFNPGEPTYGVTAPLWTLLLALLPNAPPAGPLTAKLLSILCGLLTIPAFHRLTRVTKMSSMAGVAATMVWGVNAYLVRWSASGMESSLAVLLALLAVAEYQRRSRWSGLLFGLGVLARPELAVFTGVFALFIAASRDWRRLGWFLAGLLLVLLPWLIYARLVFGTLTPNTALVKGGFSLAAAADVWMSLKRTLAIVGSTQGLELLFLATVLLLPTLRRMVSGSGVREVLAPVVLAGGLLVLQYVLQGVFVQSRYLMVLLPFITWGAFLLLDGITASKPFRRRLLTGAAALLVVQQLAVTALITVQHVNAFQPTIRALKVMAGILNEIAPPDAVVAVGDVGVIGYESGRRVLDLEGLVSPEVIPYRLQGDYDSLLFKEYFLKAGNLDYIIDKSLQPFRLWEAFPERYLVVHVEEVPGGLVGHGEERWFYTLYQIEPESKEGKSGGDG